MIDAAPPGEIEQQISMLKELAENSLDHIVITDIGGFIIYANPAVKKITGFGNSEIIGSKAGKLWGGQMDLEYYQDLWDIIKNQKKVYVGRITNRKKTGEIYEASITVVPILDKEGNLWYFTGTERVI